MSWGSGRMVTYVDSLGSNKILHYKGATGAFIGTFASMTGAPKGVLFARLSLRSLVSWGGRRDKRAVLDVTTGNV